MFTLERPNMAVNDPRVRGGSEVRRFQMMNTWDISANESPAHVIEWVRTVAGRATGGRLRNLVLSCHGGPGELELGQGFDNSNAALFGGWAGKVEKIWLPDCKVASGAVGETFCSGMARRMGCYVVAATELQCESVDTFPMDQMSSFEGLVVCYGPGGDLTWSSRNPSMWIRSNSIWNRLLGRGGACVQVPD